MTEPVDWLLIRSDLLQDLVGEAEGAAAKYHQEMKGYRQAEHDRLDQLVGRARLALQGPAVPWAEEIQVLQDQIERLQMELEVCKHDESNIQYWAGQDDGCLGAAGRWQEALTNPMPKAGVMGEPLETLYRQTEALRRDLEGFHGISLELASVTSDLALVRGQRDGYVAILVKVLNTIEKQWQPHNEASRAACEHLLSWLGDTNDAAWAAIAEGRKR